MAPLIIQPFTFLINLVFQNAVFPQGLKLSKTIPVYKKGDKSCISNYRPISVVPAFSKIIEVCAKFQLSEYLENNNILSNSQFGFRSGRSTVMAVDSVVTDILGA